MGEVNNQIGMVSKTVLRMVFFDTLFRLILALYAWRPLVINIVLHAYETQQKNDEARTDTDFARR